MKNFFLALSLISFVFLNAEDNPCIKESSSDKAMNSVSATDEDGNEKCFNMYDDGDNNSKQSISTKIMQQEFTLKVKETTDCQYTYNISDENFTIINNLTNKEIKDKDGNTIEGDYDKNGNKVTFTVPDKYKNLTILMRYKKEKKGYSSSGKKDASDKSTDNFAVRPYEYNLTLKKTNLKVGEITSLKLNLIDKDGNTITDYNISSTEFDANTTPKNIPVQYAFDILNGVSLPSGIISFLKAQKDMTLILRDPAYAKVDADDTTEVCKDINGTADVNVTENKVSSWGAGSSTGNSSNSPDKKTITSDIKQNQNRDLHFQKMGW